MIYCPYIDRDIPRAQSSPEHIIPLSLGGVDGLEIFVDSAFNSHVGSKLDGALANEFLFALNRTKFDTRGHSGKKPVALIRTATYGEDSRPAQVQFHSKDGLKIWDSRDREFKERVPSFGISLSIDIDLPVRFASKVALAAGWGLVPPVRRPSSIPRCHEHRSAQARSDQAPCGRSRPKRSCAGGNSENWDGRSSGSGMRRGGTP